MPIRAATEAARPATDADVARIAELCRLAGEELEPTRGGTLFMSREARAEPLEESLHEYIELADRALLAGTLDGHIVGVGSIEVQTLRDGQRIGVIGELFVEPQAREAGVGEVLMAGLIDWAIAQNCDGMDATALPGNRATKNFFESNGFTARLLVMHRRLTEPGQ